MDINREDIAWSAGFFEGEGCIVARNKYPSLNVAQVDPEPLYKMQTALGVGLVRGPYLRPSASANKSPHYEYHVHGFERVQHALVLMWPWLSQRRRNKAIEVLTLAQSTPPLRIRNPEGFTLPQNRTHCPRGHEYNKENTLRTKLGRRCRACAREKRREERADSKCSECDNLVTIAGFCSKHYELHQASLGSLCSIDECQRGQFTKRLCGLHYRQSRSDPSKIAPGLRTHCPQGHEYNEENTYVSKRGSRTCKICRREAGRKYMERKKN